MALKCLVFDCDGVILDSVPVKTRAFARLAEPYGEEARDRFVMYHTVHGGVSRYKKFEWFFREILDREITPAESEEWGRRFAEYALHGVFGEGADQTCVCDRAHKLTGRAGFSCFYRDNLGIVNFTGFHDDQAAVRVINTVSQCPKAAAVRVIPGDCPNPGDALLEINAQLGAILCDFRL